MLAPTHKHRLLTPRKRAVAAWLFSAVLIAAVGFAQSSASWHEGSFRHVICAEHGEAIEVGVVASQGAPVTRHPAASTEIQSADSAETIAHKHCSAVLAFRGGTKDRGVREFTRFVLPPVVDPSTGEPAAPQGRAIVLAGAPKTSPPAA